MSVKFLSVWHLGLIPFFSGEFLHSIILRPKKLLGSWNLVNPFLSENEAWMDECDARLQPLVDQYKPIQHQTFAIIRRSDRNNPIMSWGQQNLFLKRDFEKPLLEIFIDQVESIFVIFALAYLIHLFMICCG